MAAGGITFQVTSAACLVEILPWSIDPFTPSARLLFFHSAWLCNGTGLPALASLLPTHPLAESTSNFLRACAGRLRRRLTSLASRSEWRWGDGWWYARIFQGLLFMQSPRHHNHGKTWVALLGCPMPEEGEGCAYSALVSKRMPFNLTSALCETLFDLGPMSSMTPHSPPCHL